MSAVVCGSKRRSFFEDPLASSNSPTSSYSKRPRFASSVRFFPLSYPSKQFLLDRLREIFPDMEDQFERVLEECGNDLDSTIKSLHELCLGSGKGLGPANDSVEKTVNNSGVAATFEEPLVPENANTIGAELVELIVQEMMGASSVDDAKTRVRKVLGNFEESMNARARSEAQESFHKEYMAVKEQMEEMIRQNSILKHAVLIQHERQKEYDERSQEVQYLRQLTSQYQEQLKTLKEKNYALGFHLRQAQQGSSIPGHFHPDLF